MNKRQAEAIGRDIERHGCTVTGYRRWVSPNERVAIWSVDAKDNDTGISFTVDRAEQWEERKRAWGANLVATANPGRPPLSPDGVRMTYHSIAMPDALWAWAEATGNRSEAARKAVEMAKQMEPILERVRSLERSLNWDVAEAMTNTQLIERLSYYLNEAGI